MINSLKTRKISNTVMAFLIGLGLFSLISLSGCELNSNISTYPAFTDVGTIPNRYGRKISSGANIKTEDLEVCNNAAAQASEHVKTAPIRGVGLDIAPGTSIGNSETKVVNGTDEENVSGTLFGINEHRRQDQIYQNAYRTCMQQRGY